MSLDLTAMFNEGKKALDSKAVGAILLGASGNGKSRACGTFGVKTLYLYTSGESHGPQSAALGGSEILPICIDQDKGVQLSPDDAYKRLLGILAEVDQLKKLGIGAIALDGASEVENIITQTSAYKARVAAEFKGNTSFAGPVVLAMFRPILNALQDYRIKHNIHFVITCILSIKELSESGEIADAEPKLNGYQVATGIVQQHPDVIAIGHVSNGEQSKPCFQWGAHIQKSTKDFVTKEVRKLTNFHTRLTGVDMSEAPANTVANFARIIEFKKAGKYVAKGG